MTQQARIQTAGRLDWIAAGAIVLSVVAFGLIRVACVDVPWHLATARSAVEQGHWPTTNGFSYTYPDYPLYQQYPVFQTVLYAVYCTSGWAGLSVLTCAGWLLVLLLFVRWGGRWTTAAWMHLPWMLAAMALQRRMILRPDMLSMVWFACELLLVDAYLRRSRWWIVGLPLIHLAWVNTHQLFPLSFAVQGLLMTHLVLCRLRWFRTDPTDRAIPIWPVVLAFGASLLASFGSPLGIQILKVMAHTGGSLSHHREHVREFAFIWQRPLELKLAIVCSLLALYALWRSRHAGRPFEVGLWLMSLALVLSAVRGLVFFGVVSVGLFIRVVAHNRMGTRPSGPKPSRPFLRGAMACVTLLWAGSVVYYRWVRPPMVLGGTQPGLGRTLGDWPDAALRFLHESPPPGRMMNVPWSLANAMIWYLPEVPPFVDPRFEAYPREFLLDCIASHQDDATLDRLVEAYEPLWIFADHRVAGVRERLARLIGSRGWAPVYADTHTMILVRPTAETRKYLDEHRRSLEALRPHDLLAAPADLRARQRTYFALLLDALGRHDAAREHLLLAAHEARAHAPALAFVADAGRSLGLAIHVNNESARGHVTRCWIDASD